MSKLKEVLLALIVSILILGIALYITYLSFPRTVISPTTNNSVLTASFTCSKRLYVGQVMACGKFKITLQSLSLLGMDTITPLAKMSAYYDDVLINSTISLEPHEVAGPFYYGGNTYSFGSFNYSSFNGLSWNSPENQTWADTNISVEQGYAPLLSVEPTLLILNPGKGYFQDVGGTIGDVGFVNIQHSNGLAVNFSALSPYGITIKDYVTFIKIIALNDSVKGTYILPISARNATTGATKYANVTIIVNRSS